ncbi:MAG TPA: hypothetical protein PKY12_01195 [Catalimonadaceae bacterium]|nr:hypothetical protein [Catalimonadaceae bacterium]
MALTPCKFHLSDGKVLSFAEAKQYLFDNPDLMEVESNPTTPEEKPAIPVRNYREAFDKIAEGANLTQEEIEDYLPAILAENGIPGSIKNKKVQAAWDNLMNTPESEFDIDEKTNEGTAVKKVVEYIKSQQQQASIKPKTAAEKVLEWTAKQREEMKGTATSGGALYIALLDAIDAAIKAGKTVAEAIAEFRGKYTNQQKVQAEQAIAHFKKGAPASVAKQLAQRNTPTKREVQKQINKAFDIGFGYGTEAGERTGIKEGKKAAAASMKAALTGLKADLTPKQINGLLDRFAKVKDFSPESKQRFWDYATKVIDDANYVLQERAGTALKNSVKKLSQSASIPANDRILFKQFAGLSIGHMEPDVLEKYIEWGTKIKGRALQKGDRAQLVEFIADQKEVQDQITKNRSDKMKAGRERNQQEEFDRLKKEGQLPDGVTTFEEYQESVKPKSKAETHEQQVARVTDLVANLEIPETIDSQSKQILDGLKKTDLSELSADKLTLLENAINNFEDTGTLFAAGNILAEAQALNGVKALKESGIKQRKQVDVKDAKRLSLTNIFGTLFRTMQDAARVRSVLIQGWLSKSSSAFEKYVTEELNLLKDAKRLGINQKNWNRIDLYGFLNEAEDNPELFQKLLKQKLSDLAQLKEMVERNKTQESSETSESAKERYQSLKDAMESLGVKEGIELSDISLSKPEMEMYRKTREALDRYAPDAIRNMELYGNKEVGYITNYWPRNAIRNKENTKQVEGELEDFAGYESDKVGQNLFGREKGRTQLLGENGYYEPIGQINFFNGLRETMMIANTAHEYHQMQAIYNNKKGFDSFVEGDGKKQMKELFIEMIQDTKNHGRYTIDKRGWVKQGWDGIMKGLTAGLMKNPTQALKQPSALSYTLAVAPKATAEASLITTQLIQDSIKVSMGVEKSELYKAYEKLVGESTLAIRLKIPEIIEISDKYAGDRNAVIQAGKNALSIINKIALGESMTIADKGTSVIATLAGYINHQLETGKLKKASDFDLVKEAKKGFDLDAISAGEQMQGQTNNENSRLLFSKNQKLKPELYFLTNFTVQAVRNLYIGFRKAVSPLSTQAERKQGIAIVAGYLLMASAFQGAKALTTAVAQLFAENLLLDDDDEDKEAQLKALEEAKRQGKIDGAILEEAMNVALGTQNALWQMAGDAALYSAMEFSMRYAKEVEKNGGELPEAIKSRLTKEYTPLFEPGGVGQAGIMAEQLLKPLVSVGYSKPEDRLNRGLQEIGLLTAKIGGLSSPAYMVNQYLTAGRRIEKAEEFGEKTATQQIREKSAEEGEVSTGELKAQLQTNRIKDLPRKDAKALYENLTNDAVSSRYKWGEREAFRVLKTLFKNEKGLKLDNGKLIETTFTDAEKEAIKQAYIQQLKERDEMVSLLNQLNVKNYYGSRIDWDAKNKKESDWSKFVR